MPEVTSQGLVPETEITLSRVKREMEVVAETVWQTIKPEMETTSSTAKLETKVVTEMTS